MICNADIDGGNTVPLETVRAKLTNHGQHSYNVQGINRNKHSMSKAI